MVLFEKDALLQQILEEGQLKREQFRLLFSLNRERAMDLEAIGKAISYLREARDLLEPEDYKADLRISRAEERLEMSFEVKVTLFEKDFEKKSEEEKEK